MNNLKLTSQWIEKNVFISKFENKKIIDNFNVTKSFNNCVVNVFKTNDRIITNDAWKRFKITIEQLDEWPFCLSSKPDYLSSAGSYMNH